MRKERKAEQGSGLIFLKRGSGMQDIPLCKAVILALRGGGLSWTPYQLVIGYGL